MLILVNIALTSNALWFPLPHPNKHTPILEVIETSVWIPTVLFSYCGNDINSDFTDLVKENNIWSVSGTKETLSKGQLYSLSPFIKTLTILTSFSAILLWFKMCLE